MPRSNNQLIESVREIRLASRTLVRELGFLNKHLAGTELSPPQVHALLELERFPTTQASDLQRLFRLNKSAVSRLLTDLQRRGFITRVASEIDARGRILRLTKQGRQQLAVIHKKADRQFTAALQTINEQEHPVLVKSLQAFAQALSSTRHS